MSLDLDRGELAEFLASERQAWVRIAVSRQTATPILRSLEVSLAYAPPTWESRWWEYPQAVLAAYEVPGADVAGSIRKQEVDLGSGLVVSLTDLTTPARYERRASYAWSSSETLAWPADEWRAPLSNQHSLYSGELIANNSPSFIRFEVGLANLLGIATQSNWNNPQRELLVRREDRSARISRVFVGDGGVDVAVEGHELLRATVELAGDEPGEARQIASGAAQDIRFDAPSLPRGAWILLHRDGKWLDRRILSNVPTPEAGVEYESSANAEDDSPFTLAEQQQLQAALAAVKVAVVQQLPPGESTDRLARTLDQAADEAAHRGRRDWRVYLYGALVDLGVQKLASWDHITFVLGLLRGAVLQLHGLELPALEP